MSSVGNSPRLASAPGMELAAERSGRRRDVVRLLDGKLAATLGLMLVDLAALTLAALAVAHLVELDPVIATASVTTLLLLFLGTGTYRSRRGSAEELRLLWLAIVLSSLMGWLWLEVADRPGAAFQVLLLGAAAAILVPVSRRGAAILARRLGFEDPLLLLVASDARLRVLQQTVLETPPPGWERKREVVLRGDDADLQRIRQAVATAPSGCRIVLDVASIDPVALQTLTDELDRSGLCYLLLPSDIGAIPSTFETQGTFAGDLWWLGREGIAVTSATGQSLKRVVDVLLASVLILFTAPLLLVLMALVKLDGGPIFFRSSRVGRGGKLFDCVKLRTMVVGADRVLSDLLSRDPAIKQVWESEFKLPNDPRITWIGRFLRRSSLDELPQLLNVLIGQMSLVGPRPLLPEERPIYGDSLALYTLVRPGLTGLWQVSGRNDLQYEDRIRLNNWYIRNWSLWCDVVILCRTLNVVVRGHGAR